jgi:N-acetylglucosaminyl-diphospho-decaprenol L-rhamnosyltransferase
MRSCFMVKQSSPWITVRRWAAIGDAISASCVAQRLAAKGYQVRFETHPMIAPVISMCDGVSAVSSNINTPDIDLDGAYEKDPEKRQKHFSQVWIDRANQQLRRVGIELGPPTNCRPRMKVPENVRQAMRARFAEHPRPWIMVCPRSNTYTTRQVTDGIWEQAAKRMEGSKFWLGTHPAPFWFIDLRCQEIRHVIEALSVADLLVSVDTGPMHIAAALGVPVVAIGQSSLPEMHLGDQVDFEQIIPPLNCLHCMENICPKNQFMPPCQQVDPEMIAATANRKSRCYSDGKMSAVVPTYMAQNQKLNHCLEALLPQVDEIIVTREQAGRLPPGVIMHPKIRHVVKDHTRIGFGRNVNFGVRHSNHQWLLIVNDDAYLNPNCVARMMEAAKPDTGIVTPLIRYPNGQIYVTLKTRGPGDRGWGHNEHRQYATKYKEVTESENACGCIMLMRRKAFYEAQGFDENIFCYGEDDDLSQSIRKCGYRILFTPFADAIHDEGQTSRMIPGILDIMNQSNFYVGKKWERYFEHNANRFPLGEFDYE